MDGPAMDRPAIVGPIGPDIVGPIGPAMDRSTMVGPIGPATNTTDSRTRFIDRTHFFFNDAQVRQDRSVDQKKKQMNRAKF